MAVMSSGTELSPANLNKYLEGPVAEWRMVTTELAPDGADPSATTGYGFSSTVTRNATGDYTLNFSSAFSSPPYALTPCPVDSANDYVVFVRSVTTTQVRVIVKVSGGSASDACDAVHVTLIGS